MSPELPACAPGASSEVSFGAASLGFARDAPFSFGAADAEVCAPASCAAGWVASFASRPRCTNTQIASTATRASRIRLRVRRCLLPRRDVMIGVYGADQPQGLHCAVQAHSFPTTHTRRSRMSSTTASTARLAVTDADLAPAIAARWSPRSFDEHATVDKSAIAAAIEAARWAPSAFNSQPWRFVIGRRGEDGRRGAIFDRVLPHLTAFNQAWVHRAGLVIVNAAYIEADGHTLPTAAYDLGLAVANQTLQLQYDGYDTHQISGIDASGLHDEFELPDEMQVFTVTVAGRHASPDQLDEGAREREVAPRVRRGSDELVLLSD
ncbi:hypothetical protein F8O09_07460 [Pseudoclavibacter sp. CFCC 11306]|nr:hypothetical protein F8O09_07460 [Pseudoclavibacter sp. CFCC 11306]